MGIVIEYSQTYSHTILVQLSPITICSNSESHWQLCNLLCEFSLQSKRQLSRFIRKKRISLIHITPSVGTICSSESIWNFTYHTLESKMMSAYTIVYNSHSYSF